MLKNISFGVREEVALVIQKFFEAIFDGNMRKVLGMLEERCVQKQLASKWSELLLAAICSGNLEMMKTFLGHRFFRIRWLTADISVLDQVLEKAVLYGRLGIVEELLKHATIKANIASHNNHIFKLAVQCASVKLVNRLLTFPAVKKNIAINGNESLMFATKSGNLEVVRQLLTYPEVKSDVAVNISWAP